ncbi:MAG: glutaredoxin family protein [Candidatus Diapherotrites archaeon]|nr:glutaredoxin family protein [Candidatus Diapherotrites archaeon]
MAKIKVYSTKTCPYCIMAKNWLRDKKIKFEDFDVGTDRKKAEEMIEKSGQVRVPVIEIDGEIISGFDQGRIEEALKKSKNQSSYETKKI